jgi:hypothetical protein
MSDPTRIYTERGKRAHLTDQGTVSLCGIWYPELFQGTGTQAEYERAADLPLCKRCKRKNGNQDVPNAVHQERYKPGTLVHYWPGVKVGHGTESRTRSAVWAVGGTLCVAVDGYAGGIALSHIEIIPGRHPEVTP